MPAHYEVFEDEEGGGFRWRFVNADNETVLQSEVFTTQSAASRGALDAQKASDDAPVE